MAPETIRLVGGSLALDFANTVDWTADETEIAATDALADRDALDRWAARLGLAGGAGPHDELRRAIHRAFSALARGEEPASLPVLHAAYADAVAHATLGPTGFAWARVDHAVAADAVALLGDPARLQRLHRCPGRDCGWLFVDASGRRRWCSMATCGSREKMRRLYARRRATPAP